MVKSKYRFCWSRLFYVPLKDSEETDLSIEEIKESFSSGEWYDYYLNNTCKKTGFNNNCDRWKDLAG